MKRSWSADNDGINVRFPEFLFGPKGMWDLKLRLHRQSSSPYDVVHGVQTEPVHVLQCWHVPNFSNHATAKDSYFLTAIDNTFP